jgi:hypothetical protein
VKFAAIVFKGHVPGRQGTGMGDVRRPSVGEIAYLQVPRADGRPAVPIAVEVLDLFGHIATLRPKDELDAGVRAGAPAMVRLAARTDPFDVEGEVLDVQRDGSFRVRLALPPERRQHERRHRECRLLVQAVKSASEPALQHHCSTLDISAGGLRVQIPGPLSAGDKMFTTIFLPDEPPVLAMAELIDAVPLDGDSHEGRLRFTTISEDERGRLARFIACG